MLNRKLTKEEIERFLNARWVKPNHQVTRWVVENLAQDGMLDRSRVMSFTRDQERAKAKGNG